MARGRPGEAAARRLIAGILILVGLFVACFGVGNQSVTVVVIGILVAALALGARISTSLRPRPRQWVAGRGRVVMVSDEPPTTGDHGRCELHLTVEAPGIPAETVVVRDPRVPVSQWPYPGLGLPIEVAADNVRNVRILWQDRPEAAGQQPWEDEWAGQESQADPVPRQPTGPPSDDPPDFELIDFDLDDVPAEEAKLDEPAKLDVPAEEAKLDEPDQGEVRSEVEPAGEPAPRPRPKPRPRRPAEPALQGIGATMLVTDLERSVRFYRDRLGLEIVDTGDGNTVLAFGSTRLVLRAARDLGKVNRRLVHLNLEVADIDAVHADLQRNGVRFTYPPRVANRSARLELWAAAFKDPDGHGIAITQWRPPDQSAKEAALERPAQP